MHRHADYPLMRNAQGDESYNMIPREVIEAIEAVLACGKEVIVRKEKGKWVVLESGRRLVYKEH